ncbi:hypothetical protein [Kroppenstedtia sanguinis]|uniref:Uncharacterized protein n=1 Tax=Kroppenstedtia sanguinis TaxID=1380684 RepID=A0ABW4CEG1_9BACL
MKQRYAVWEYRPETKSWWIHRSGFYYELARDVADSLNNNLQPWRKGAYYKAFPTSINPNEPPEIVH